MSLIASSDRIFVQVELYFLNELNLVPVAVQVDVVRVVSSEKSLEDLKRISFEHVSALSVHDSWDVGLQLLHAVAIIHLS